MSDYDLKIIRNRLDMVYRALDNSSDFASKEFIRCMIGSAAVVLESEFGMREVEREISDSKAEKGAAPCPCGEPAPKGYPPCTFEKPCSYGQGMPKERWDHEREQFKAEKGAA